MNISFQGFKNAGAQYITESVRGKHAADYIMLNCELTNDMSGYDLKAFQEKFTGFTNSLNPNFLNIYMTDDITNSKRVFKINNRTCEINDKNLGKYTFIADFLKKIISTPKNNFNVSSDYICSDGFAKTYYFDENSFEEMINAIFSTKNIKDVCKRLIECITEEHYNCLS